MSFGKKGNGTPRSPKSSAAEPSPRSAAGASEWASRSRSTLDRRRRLLSLRSRTRFSRSRDLRSERPRTRFSLSFARQPREPSRASRDNALDVVSKIAFALLLPIALVAVGAQCSHAL